MDNFQLGQFARQKTAYPARLTALRPAASRRPVAGHARSIESPTGLTPGVKTPRAHTASARSGLSGSAGKPSDRTAYRRAPTGRKTRTNRAWPNPRPAAQPGSRAIQTKPLSPRNRPIACKEGGPWGPNVPVDPASALVARLVASRQGYRWCAYAALPFRLGG